MTTEKYSVVECLDKGVVACFYEGVVACLYEGMVSCLDKVGKDNFDVDIINRLKDCFEYFFSHNHWL